MTEPTNLAEQLAAATARAEHAEARIEAVRATVQEWRHLGGMQWAIDRILAGLNGPKAPLACPRCHDRKIVPDWSNWDAHHGEPKPKPCPDCVLDSANVQQQIITLPPKPTPPGPMLVQPCTTDRDVSSFEGLGALADTIAAMARSEAAEREAKISNALAEYGFTVVRTQPVEEAAAETDTLTHLGSALTRIASQDQVPLGQIGDLTGWPLVTDDNVPPGEIHFRPHPRFAAEANPTEGPACSTFPGCDGQCCAKPSTSWRSTLMVSTHPQEEVAAEPATLAAWLQGMRDHRDQTGITPEWLDRIQSGNMPLVDDEQLPAGEIHLRPRSTCECGESGAPHDPAWCARSRHNAGVCDDADAPCPHPDHTWEPRQEQPALAPEVTLSTYVDGEWQEVPGVTAVSVDRDPWVTLTSGMVTIGTGPDAYTVRLGEEAPRPRSLAQVFAEAIDRVALTLTEPLPWPFDNVRAQVAAALKAAPSCCICGSYDHGGGAFYENYQGRLFCWPCADGRQPACPLGGQCDGVDCPRRADHGPRPAAEPERPAGWCPTCEGRSKRVPE